MIFISAKIFTINIQMYYNTYIKTFNTIILVLELLIIVLEFLIIVLFYIIYNFRLNII